VETLLLIHVVSFKWDAELPFPSVQTLASRMGVSPRYVRRLLSSLERRGFVARVPRARRSNEYDLQPLVDRLELEVRDTKTARQRAKAAREAEAQRLLEEEVRRL
jgi:DNA-binding transcriptional regulator YhcF (GntR family)